MAARTASIDRNEDITSLSTYVYAMAVPMADPGIVGRGDDVSCL